jgi:transcriptional regulator with XRE-family HTH domain
MPVANNKEFLKAFGDHLYKVRIRRGISRVQLAFEVNTTEKHLRLIEKGEISTGLSNLFKIAQALEIDLSELFDFDY